MNTHAFRVKLMKRLTSGRARQAPGSRDTALSLHVTHVQSFIYVYVNFTQRNRIKY